MTTSGHVLESFDCAENCRFRTALSPNFRVIRCRSSLCRWSCLICFHALVAFRAVSMPYNPSPGGQEDALMPTLAQRGFDGHSSSSLTRARQRPFWPLFQVLSRPQCRWAQPYHLDQGDALGLEAYAGFSRALRLWSLKAEMKTGLQSSMVVLTLTGNSRRRGETLNYKPLLI
jgi:hypothetical protein